MRDKVSYSTDIFSVSALECGIILKVGYVMMKMVLALMELIVYIE